MEEKTIRYFEKAAMEGTVPDDKNPIFLFNGIHSELLMQIAAGKLDAVAIARRELVNRGYTEYQADVKKKGRKYNRGKRTG